MLKTHHLLANCVGRSLAERVEEEAREPVRVRRRVSKVVRARRQEVVTSFGIDLVDELLEQLGGLTLSVVLDTSSLGLRRVQRDDSEV